MSVDENMTNNLDDATIRHMHIAKILIFSKNNIFFNNFPVTFLLKKIKILRTHEAHGRHFVEETFGVNFRQGFFEMKILDI